MKQAVPHSRATQRDVAARAGVSRGLVSQVLSGRDRASDEVRQRILAAADELGYRPNYGAAQLATSRSGVIALGVRELGNPIYRELFEGMADACADVGYTVLIAVLDFREARAEQTVDRLLGIMPDGIVLVAPEASDAALASIVKTTPTMITGQRCDVPGVGTVTFDEQAAAVDIVRHLQERGAERLYFISSPGAEAEAPMESRRCAVQRAAADAGLPCELLRCRTDEAGEAADVLVPSGRVGLVAYNDVLAVEVLASVREAGGVLGEDVLLASYDDSPLASRPRNSLTSIRIGPRMMGGVAVNALLGGESASASLLVPHRLVVRASTAGGEGGARPHSEPAPTPPR